VSAFRSSMATDAPNETFGNTAADALSPAGHDRDAAGEQDLRQFDGHRFKPAGEPWPLTPLTCSARCMAGARLITPSASSSAICSSIRPRPDSISWLCTPSRRAGRVWTPARPREDVNASALCRVRSLALVLRPEKIGDFSPPPVLGDRYSRDQARAVGMVGGLDVGRRTREPISSR